MSNVIINSDSTGKHEINSFSTYKYNIKSRNRSVNNLENNSVFIIDEDKIHENCVIINDQGKNTLSLPQSQHDNIFIKALNQVRKEPINIESFLKKKRESLQDKLKAGTQYFNNKSYVYACDSYKDVITMIETDAYPDEFMLQDSDILALKFGYSLSKMAICKTDELQTAIRLLTGLKDQHGDEYPTLYYYLARCLFLLEKYQDAKSMIEVGQKKLKNLDYLSELNWPGSDIKMIVKTEKSLLDNNFRTLLRECDAFKLPDYRCFLPECETKNIFFNSLCFNGYVVVKCTNKCNFTYHRKCWKMKLKLDTIKKPSSFLGKLCPTDSCNGSITEILIYDEKLHLNTFIKPKQSDKKIDVTKQFNVKAKEFIPNVVEPPKLDHQQEIKKLKSEVSVLQSQLFQSEESYNNLLTQKKLLQKKLHEAQTKQCDNCTKLESIIAEKNDEYEAATIKLKNLDDSNTDLTKKLKELQTALNVQQQEHESISDYSRILATKNELLQRKNDDLLARMNHMAQQLAYMQQHDNLHLRKAMFDQINYIQHAHASYFTLFENKSKHMLWELEDIKALSTSTTSPSEEEIVENMTVWKNALDDAIKGRRMMGAFYEDLHRQFSYKSTNPSMPLAFPSLIVEPPNIIVRHFKSLIIVNKRLTQELQQQVTSFYKMISTPYPEVFAPKETPEIQENKDEILQNLENVSTSSSSWDSVQETKQPNLYDNLATTRPLGPSLRTITNQSVCDESSSRKSLFDDETSSRKSLFDESSSRKENTPNNNLMDKYEVGAIPKYLPSTSTCKPKKPDIIGHESLVDLYQEKLPLVPRDLISRGVNMLRDRSGGLSKKNWKQISVELKQVLKEIAITDKCLRKSKEEKPKAPEPATPKAWNKLTNGLHWNNENPEVNCSICFEYMNPDKRTQLHCQHIFHTTCIKSWLRTDSICPICRQFSTLDDEFPPLK